MKRFSTYLLAFTALGSLSACGGGGPGIFSNMGSISPQEMMKDDEMMKGEEMMKEEEMMDEGK